MNPLFADLTTTIFEEMSALAREHDALNLGQGFPDGTGPEDILLRASDALLRGSNQYPPMRGLLELRKAVTAHYARHQDLHLDLEEVVVTSGATEALAASLLALLAPGDEVVLIQPMYDAYLPLVLLAGARPRHVTLTPPEWLLTEAALEAAVTPASRVLVLNNPLNPAARVFTQEELEAVAHVCRRHDLIAVCDEVWEHVVFDDRRHVPLMSLPGMRDRTVKIGSAGKMFSLTGWKVGFACASPALIEPIARAHQFLTFTTPPNLQSAVAYGLSRPPAAFREMSDAYGRSRDRLTAALRADGWAALQSEGTYFTCIDLRASGVEETDRDFVHRSVVDFGVAAIPLSSFYAHQPADGIVRLCFAKSDDVLDEAARRLGAARRAASTTPARKSSS